MSICTRIVVAVALKQIDNAQDTKTCAKCDNQSL